MRMDLTNHGASEDTQMSSNSNSSNEDDPIEAEYPVYLSRQLCERLYLLQYPVRPNSTPYDDAEHLGARCKPKQGRLELEFGLNTRSPNYDASKGEQVAINVDGATISEKSCYRSGKMDKQVLTSSNCSIDITRYAVGMMKDGELHITPINKILHMRPSLNYLDKADQRQKGCEADEADTADEEPEAKAVTVRFARRETEEGKARRLASFDHLRKIHDEELWVDLSYHAINDSFSEGERQLLYARLNNEVTEFHMQSERYLEQLIPKMELKENEKPEMPTNVLSLADLRKMNLSDKVKALLVNAKLIRTSQLMSLLPKGTDATATIRCLQQVAMLVQGCWVVKSEILYPKEAKSAHSGAPSEALCRSRDYIMWRFTQSRYIVRKDITPVVKLVAEDVKDILEQMSHLKVNKGWEFKLECDSEFINRHPDVMQRQNMIWDAKFKQLNTTLKLPASDIKLASQAAVNPPSPSKRRRTVSRSRTKSGDRSESLSESDNEFKKAERSRRQSGSSRRRKASGEDRHSISDSNEGEQKPSYVNMENSADAVTENSTCQNGALSNNIAETITMASESEIREELCPFIKEKLCRHYVMKMSDLKSMFTMYLATLPPGHMLARGVGEKLLEQTVFDAGGVKMLNSSPKCEESVYAMPKVGEKNDEVRQLLVDFIQKQPRFQQKVFIKHVESCSDTKYEQSVIKKIIKDYCESKGSMFHLKGTIPNS